jgi:methylglutaconyl-CoA hydratase
MATQELTRYERRGPAAWITLDSPQNRNALSAPLVQGLGEHLRAALADRAVRAIVLTGTGPAFCAGADLKSRGDAVAPGSGKANPFVEILRLMWDGPKPVVVAANGHAFGGGLGLVAAADIALAADTASFSFSEVRVGVIPAMISVVVLPKLGPHHAMRLFLTGARFTAAEAVGYGLLHRAVPAGELAAAAQAEVDAIALGGPIAIAEAKRLVRTVPRLSMDEAFAWTEAKIAALFASEEAAEGMMAFAGKRKPRWAEESGT